MDGFVGQQKAVCERIRTKAKIPPSGREAADQSACIEKASFGCDGIGIFKESAHAHCIVPFWPNVTCRIIGMPSPE